MESVLPGRIRFGKIQKIARPQADSPPLLPRSVSLSIQRWRYPHQPREHPREIVRVFDPQGGRCFLDGHAGEHEVLAGLLDLEMVEVVDGGVAGACAEDDGEMRDGQLCEGGKFLKGNEGMDLLLHQLDRQCDDVNLFFLLRGVEFIFIEKGRQEMVEDHIDVAEIVAAIALFQVGIDLFEELDTLLAVAEAGFVLLCVLPDQLDDVGGQFALEVKPVNGPGIVFIGRIFVRDPGRDDDELGRVDLYSFFADLYPAAAYHAIDDDMLADAVGTLNIVVLGLWVIAYVGDIDLPGHRIPGQKISSDLLWQYDQSLPLEALSFA
jgi:hypothetical protein